MIRVHSFLIFLLSVLILSCSSSRDIGGQKIMTFSECSDSDVCLLEGIVTIEEVNHVFMGCLKLDSGSCVQISLDNKYIKKIRKARELKIRVYGDRMGKPVGMDGVDFLKVDGRRVGWDLCSDFYLFVTKVIFIE